MNCYVIMDILMSDVEIINCCTNSTHIVENKDEEPLENVAENMFTVYSPVRSFSCVINLDAGKKKKKTTHQREEKV